MATLTFLFTDIEGSTALLQRLGDDAFSDVLVNHHRLMRFTLRLFEGREEGTSGDSFFAVFASVSDCVAAVVALQKTFGEFDWPVSEHLAVRMGVHMGEASQSETGLVGYDVHRASRIAAAAHGGQVLLSSSAAEAVAPSLPPGVSLQSLGSFSLKDLVQTESLYQLVIEGLASDFPPPRAVSQPYVDADTFGTPRDRRRVVPTGPSVAHLSAALNGTIGTLGRFTESREPDTAGHQVHVGSLASSLGTLIAARHGLDSEAIDRIRQAGELHDIGKIAVPSEILTRAVRLSELEFEMVKQHTTAGHDILSKASLPWPIPEVALQHHERMDGSGYPHGIAGEEIILPARIIAVADVLESMTQHRAHRLGFGVDEALDWVRASSGTLFDPEVVDACVSVFDEGFASASEPASK